MSQSFTYTGTTDYIASPDLMQTVNVAVQLSRPLLIKGEPGTGKTMLAQSIARGLEMPLLVWNVKSTTKAQDGLYVYDTVQRLYDGQFGDGDVADIAQYIKFGKLGQAFSGDERVVLLIDEIDKADLEFPNDLLWELDQMEFSIPETRETVKAKQRPIVLITSNAEKELPDAFLRRCVFHYIEFPDEEMMERIVRVHVPAARQAPPRPRHPGVLLAARRARPAEEAQHQRAHRLGAGAGARRRRPQGDRRAPALHGRAAQEGPRRRHRQPGARERPAALAGAGSPGRRRRYDVHRLLLPAALLRRAGHGHRVGTGARCLRPARSRWSRRRSSSPSSSHAARLAILLVSVNR